MALYILGPNIFKKKFVSWGKFSKKILAQKKISEKKFVVWKILGQKIFGS